MTWEHGAAAEDGRGNVAVEYAFAEYSLADWARFRAGKMFTPFGIYNEIHTAKPAFLSVKEPLATNKNNKLGSPMRFYPRWGAGVALLGNGVAPLGIAWDYVVALTNGEQESTNPFEEDDNKQKAIQGRVRAHLLDQLELGVSAYRDSLTELDALGDATSGRTAQLSYHQSVNKSIWNDLQRFDLNPELAKFTFPTLVVTGRFDFNVAPSVAWSIHRAIPGSELAVFEQSGHLPYCDESAAFASRVERFLTSH